MKKNSHFQIDMKKLISIALLVIGIIGVQVSTNDLYGQTNRNKKHNNFSSIGKSQATIRHGITLQVLGNLSAKLTQMDFLPCFGLGYSATQYYGVGNRVMQQSVTYQIGFGTSGNYIVHNLMGTFHCSFIGSWDMNPFIYGIALHFAYATRSDAGTNKPKLEPYANFYIRPEIGLMFPFKYSKRSAEVHRVSGSITYGFNIRTFYNFDPKYQGEYYPDNVLYPWTAMNHHVITLRLNINIGNQREMRK